MSDADGAGGRTDERPVVTYLREHAGDVVGLAERLLAHDTRNPPGETRELADWLADWLADRGLAVDRVVADPAKPNLVATLPGEGDRALLFNGHLDTVPYDADEWAYDPLGERDGDHLYGRGATDMKGPLAAMLSVAEAYYATGETPPVTLVYALVTDEETGGSAGTRALLERAPPDADGCVIGETTCEGGRHSVTVADRGSIWLTLTAEGEAAHGSRPMLGVNAIDRLYEAVECLREALAVCALDLPPEVEPIVAESVDYYAPTLGEETARRLFSHPTCNLGTIEGGNAVNTVPDAATAELDVRLSPGVDTAAVLADVRACLADLEGVAIADVSWSRGSYTPPDDPVVTATVETAEAVTGETIHRRSATGGGDAKSFRNAGIPTVEFALGTETAHAVDEYTTAAALAGNAEIYARLPAAFAAATR